MQGAARIGARGVVRRGEDLALLGVDGGDDHVARARPRPPRTRRRAMASSETTPASGEPQPERDALGRGHADADPGERAGADVAGQPVEGAAPHARLREDGVDGLEDPLGVALEIDVGHRGERLPVADQRGAAAGRRGGEGEDLHRRPPGNVAAGRLSGASWRTEHEARTIR